MRFSTVMLYAINIIPNTCDISALGQTRSENTCFVTSESGRHELFRSHVLWSCYVGHYDIDYSYCFPHDMCKYRAFQVLML